MKCPTSFNTLWEQELRAELWQMHVAVQEAAGGTRTRQKNRCEKFLGTQICTEDASEKEKARSEDPRGLSTEK